MANQINSIDICCNESQLLLRYFTLLTFQHEPLANFWKGKSQSYTQLHMNRNHFLYCFISFDNSCDTSAVNSNKLNTLRRWQLCTPLSNSFVASYNDRIQTTFANRKLVLLGLHSLSSSSSDCAAWQLMPVATMGRDQKENYSRAYWQNDAPKYYTHVLLHTRANMILITDNISDFVVITVVFCCIYRNNR